MRNKRGVAPLFVILIIATIFGAIAFNVVDIGTITGSGGYIQRPVFYYDKCEQTGSLKYSVNYNLATSGNWLIKPSATDSYEITINSPKPLGVSSVFSIPLGGYRVEYYVCNSKLLREDNCRAHSFSFLTGKTNTIQNIKPEEYVWAQYQKLSFLKWVEDSGATYQVVFQPYGVRQYNVLGGSGAWVNQNSCTYPSRPSDTIISEDINKVSKPEERTTNQQTLKPNEVRWYVAGYLSSAGPSFALSYNRQDAWCRPTGSSAEIYAINEIKTNGGTYKVASADWSDYLGSEKCCPGQTQGDKVCNDKFVWGQVKGSECSAFNPCGSPNWVPSDEKQIIKYSCENGRCESETRIVECASDFDCKDTNEVCDLNSFECVQANIRIDGQEIITQVDSEAECIDKGGAWITQESEDGSFLNFIGIGEPDIIVTEFCEFESGFNWTLWVIVAVIVIIVIMFFPQIGSGIKALLGKVGL